MTKETQLAALYFRKNKLERNGKNSKSQGVLRKINRQIRNCWRVLLLGCN